MPVGIPDIKYINSTEAMGFRLVAPDSFTARWDEALKIGTSAYFDRQSKERWYGLLNWGDWFGERNLNWGNQEYDTPAIFFDQGMRFVNPDYFREAVRGATHMIDVDTISSHADYDRTGAVWAHSLGHTGGYYLPEELPFDKKKNYGDPGDIFFYGRSVPGHTRARGVSLAYVFTGNPRFLEHAEKIGDHLIIDPMFRVRNWTGTAREPGWTLFNLSAIYEATADPKYLKAASKLADIVLEQAAGRGVRHTFLGNSRNAPKRPFMKDSPKLYPDGPTLGELSFPTAYQTVGMIAVYRLTGRKDILENIKETSDYIQRRLWSPDGKGFFHSPCPWRTQTIKIGAAAGGGLSYVFAFDAACLGRNEAKEKVGQYVANMFETDQYFGILKDESQPSFPLPKNFSDSVYFWPQTLDMLKKTQSSK